MPTLKLYTIIFIVCCIIISSTSFTTSSNQIQQTQSMSKLYNKQTLKSQKIIDKTIHSIHSDQIQNSIQISSNQNLQFSNQTGTAITSDMVANYIKIINNAYSFYGSNLNLTTDYISKQLEASYGWAYNVIILQLNQATSTWSVYNVGNSVVVWSKVNTYQSNWTYIIWPLYKSSSQTTGYISGIGRGIGIDSQKETIIRNIIKAQQGKYSSCICYLDDIHQIMNKLKQFDGQGWSVICKKFSSISFNSLLKTINSQYIQLYVTTSKCEYVLAVAN